ncbi:helix-turn-helix domain-containing protein [Agromyces mediolanus]|uniref:AraC family transcriptional regulator n=1 Tax=Agromyces mediolanus TaxID=41986 RepID=UPI0038335067
MRFRSPGSAARVELIRASDLRDADGGRGALCAPQRPRFDLLIEVTAGETTHRVDFVEHRLAVGDLLWVRSGQVQQWGEPGGWEGRVVLFQPELVTPASTELLRRAGVASRARWARGSYPADVSSLLLTLGELDRAATRCAAAAVEHVLEALLLRLCGGDGPSGTAMRGSGPLYERFVRLLDEQGPWIIDRSVEAAAQLLGCTPKTLTAAVRERSGRTAKQLIDDRVVLEAKRLLAHLPDLPVREVAEALGFHDSANFSKFFKRQVGLAPAAFRAGSI